MRLFLLTTLALASTHGASPVLLRLRGGASLSKPLEKAIVQENLDALRQAIAKSKLDGTMLNAEGNSAIHVASKHGKLDALALLIDNGVGEIDARRDRDGGTPLMYASQNGHATCVERLLQAGADLNLQQAEGSAAVHYACRHGHVACLELLLASKACNLNVLRGDGISALMVAAFNDQRGCVEMLLERKAKGAAGVDIGCRSAADLAALDYACREGHAEVAALLLRAKAPKDAGQANGGTVPIHWAAEAGHATCVSALLAAGASPDASRVDGSTAVHYAAIRGRSECLRLLLEAGADASARRTNGATPLHLAAQVGNDACVSLLLAAGADVNSAVANQAAERTADLTTPLDLATQAKSRACISLIEKAGGLSGMKLMVQGQGAGAS